MRNIFLCNSSIEVFDQMIQGGYRTPVVKCVSLVGQHQHKNPSICQRRLNSDNASMGLAVCSSMCDESTKSQQSEGNPFKEVASTIC